MKCTNIQIIRVPEDEREKEVESVFDAIMAVNFPNLKKEMYPGTGSTEDPKQEEPKQAHTRTFQESKLNWKKANAEEPDGISGFLHGLYVRTQVNLHQWFYSSSQVSQSMRQTWGLYVCCSPENCRLRWKGQGWTIDKALDGTASKMFAPF